MMIAPENYITEDGYLMERVHSGGVRKPEDIQAKIDNALSLGLETIVIPIRVRYDRYEPTYELHYYRYTKKEEEVSK